MPEQVEDFESLFDEFETETLEESPVSKEEQLLLKDEGEIKTIVPENEEDFVNSQDPEDDDVIETKEKQEEPEQTEDEEDGSDYFKTVGEGLIKLGKYKEVPADFKWTEENFLNFFDEFTREKAQAEIDDILTEGWGKEGIDMFQDIFVKRVPIKEYLSLYQQELDYDTIDLTKVGNQKLMVKAYLEETGMDEEEIFEQIEILEEKGKLEERSTKYKEKIVELKTAEREQLASQAEAHQRELKRLEKERLDSIKKAVDEAIKAKSINDIPLSLEDNKSLLPYMTAPAYKTPSGQNVTQMEKDLFELRKNPTKWVALAKLIKSDLNVTPIKNKAVDDKKEDIFTFTKKKASPSKDYVEDQLDVLFKRKK